MLWSLSGAGVEGLYGPWLLLVPLALLAVRWKQGRRLLFAAAFFGLAIVPGHPSRMLLPFAVFAAPALGLAVQNSPGMLPLLLLLHSLVSWPKAVAAYADTHAWRITGLPVAAALRSIPEDRYLRNKLDGYALARSIDELTPQNARILMLSQAPQAYTTRGLWYRAGSAEAEMASQTISSAHQTHGRPAREVRFRLPDEPVRALRVIAEEQGEPWSVNEMRVYRAGVEISRSPSWRVSGEPNARAAPRAFDNSEVTAWSTLRAVKPGMYLEEDFDYAIRVDAVVLVCAPGDATGKLHVDGLLPDGHWRTLADQPGIAERLPPEGLRRAAIEEIKALGFDYIVARSDTRVGLDMRGNAAYWGITCLREISGACIYHLD